MLRYAYWLMKEVRVVSDELLYEQAMQEIRERRVVQGVWAQAFAESEGDQKKTLARYITLRVVQLKAAASVENAGVKPKPSAAAKLSGWQTAGVLVAAAITAKVFGPLSCALSFGTFAWLRPKFGVWKAGAAACTVGVAVAVGAGVWFEAAGWQKTQTAPPKLTVDQILGPDPAAPRK